MTIIEWKANTPPPRRGVSAGGRRVRFYARPYTYGAVTAVIQDDRAADGLLRVKSMVQRYDGPRDESKDPEAAGAMDIIEAIIDQFAKVENDDRIDVALKIVASCTKKQVDEIVARAQHEWSLVHEGEDIPPPAPPVEDAAATADEPAEEAVEELEVALLDPEDDSAKKVDWKWLGGFKRNELRAAVASIGDVPRSAKTMELRKIVNDAGITRGAFRDAQQALA